MKRSALRSILGFFFNDLGWKLLSLAAAVLLWIFVASEPELSTFVSVPVEYRDLPDNLEISSDVIDSVYLQLRGPSGELRGLNDGRRFAVVLDMSGVESGQRTFTIEPGEVRLPRGIHLVQAIPSQLRFEFERRIYRTVPVEVRFGPLQPGYEVAGFTVTPRVLQVVGPESRVDRIKFVVTDPVDLSGVVGQAEFHVNAYADDAHVRFAGFPQVAVRVQVRARASGAAPPDIK